MLTIRFNRTGKKNRPYFRVVLQEHTKAPGKRHVEILGSYDPLKKTTILKKDRILYWIGQGVRTSDVVHNVLIREGVIEGKKIAKKMPKPVAKEEVKAEAAPAPEVAEAPAAETPTESVPEVKAETPAPEVPAEPVKEEKSAPVEAEAPAPEAPKEEQVITDKVFAGNSAPKDKETPKA